VSLAQLARVTIRGFAGDGIVPELLATSIPPRMSATLMAHAGRIGRERQRTMGSPSSARRCVLQRHRQFEGGTAYRQVRPTRLDKIENLHPQVLLGTV